MSWLLDLQQCSGEPEAAGLSLWHEEVRDGRKLEQNVPEVQRHVFGSREGQAAVRTGICGGWAAPLQVINTTLFNRMVGQKM